MSYQITLPHGIEYVGAALMSTVFLLLGQNITVSIWRLRSGIPYPQLYAERAEVEASRNALIFNCAQRAHQNTLENLPIVYVSTLLTAANFPIFAAAACGYWSISRVAYTYGYLSGDPGRRAGTLYNIGSAALIGLILTATYSVGKVIRSLH